MKTTSPNKAGKTTAKLERLTKKDANLLSNASLKGKTYRNDEKTAKKSDRLNQKIANTIGKAVSKPYAKSQKANEKASKAWAKFKEANDSFKSTGTAKSEKQASKAYDKARAKGIKAMEADQALKNAQNSVTGFGHRGTDRNGRRISAFAKGGSTKKKRGGDDVIYFERNSPYDKALTAQIDSVNAGLKNVVTLPDNSVSKYLNGGKGDDKHPNSKQTNEQFVKDPSNYDNGHIKKTFKSSSTKATGGSLKNKTTKASLRKTKLSKGGRIK